MDWECFWFLTLRPSSSPLIMGDGQEGPEDLLVGTKSGSMVRWLVVPPHL